MDDVEDRNDEVVERPLTKQLVADPPVRFLFRGRSDDDGLGAAVGPRHDAHPDAGIDLGTVVSTKRETGSITVDHTFSDDLERWSDPAVALRDLPEKRTKDGPEKRTKDGPEKRTKDGPEK